MSLQTDADSQRPRPVEAFPGPISRPQSVLGNQTSTTIQLPASLDKLPQPANVQGAVFLPDNMTPLFGD